MGLCADPPSSCRSKLKWVFITWFRVTRAPTVVVWGELLRLLRSRLCPRFCVNIFNTEHGHKLKDKLFVHLDSHPCSFVLVICAIFVSSTGFVRNLLCLCDDSICKAHCGYMRPMEHFTNNLSFGMNVALYVCNQLYMMHLCICTLQWWWGRYTSYYSN